jgi:hypothetical protein
MKCTKCHRVGHPTHHCLIGQRVRLIRMGADPDRVATGTTGTVRFVDSMDTVFVDWDDGRKLGLVAGEDVYEIVGGTHPDSVPE